MDMDVDVDYERIDMGSNENRYRAVHLGPPYKEAPNIERAVQFAQLVSRFRKKSSADREQGYKVYPDLKKYVAFEEWLLHENVRKTTTHRGMQRFLLEYLKELQSWTLSTESVESVKQCVTPGTQTQPEFIKKANTSDKETGTLVDRQIAAVAAGQLSFDSPELHTYTRWLIQYLYQRGWLLCGTQMPVWNDSVISPITTRADMICYDTENRRFVLIELKTGYDYNYEWQRRKQEDGELKPDSYMFRHQYQLGWMHRQLAERLQTKSGKLYSVVLRINKTHGVNEPLKLDVDIESYFAKEHERLSKKQYIDSNSGNSIDPHANTK